MHKYCIHRFFNTVLSKQTVNVLPVHILSAFSSGLQRKILGKRSLRCHTCVILRAAVHPLLFFGTTQHCSNLQSALLLNTSRLQCQSQICVWQRYQDQESAKKKLMPVNQWIHYKTTSSVKSIQIDVIIERQIHQRACCEPKTLRFSFQLL